MESPDFLSGTFSFLCQRYIDDYAKKRKKTWQADQRRIDLYLLPKWGDRKAGDIKRGDINELHKEIGARAPYEANRVKEVLSRMFELANLWGMVDENARNPTKGIPDFKEEKRDRVILKEEMPALISAIEEENNVYVRNAIWFLLYTGVNKNQALKLKWSDINEESIRIGETKDGRPYYIVLTNETKKLIKETPKIEGNLHVFPGSLKGGHLVNIDKNWQRIREKAGLSDVRIHDLRRTMGGWIARSGGTSSVAGTVIKQSATFYSYHAPLDLSLNLENPSEIHL